MSTAREQLNRVVKSFTLVARRDDYSVVVPPQILLNARAAVFFKKITKGSQKHQAAAGVYFKRLGYSEWSSPVCVHMHHSDVYWGSLPRVDRADVLVLLVDPEAVHTFELYGQVGFTQHCGKLKRGLMMENSEEGKLKLAEMVSETPSLLRDDDSFVYGICDGRLFSVDIENFMLRVKDSSNKKWYLSKEASIHAILEGECQIPHPDKADLVASAHAALQRYMDVKARHPEFAALAEDVDYSSSAAPADAPAAGAATEGAARERLQHPTALASPPAPPRRPQLSSHGSTGNGSESWVSSGSSSAYNSSGLSPTDLSGNPFEMSNDVGGALDSLSLQQQQGRPYGLSMASQSSARRNSTLSAKSRGSSLGGWDDAGTAEAHAAMLGTWERGQYYTDASSAHLQTIPQGRPLPPTSEAAAKEAAAALAHRLSAAEQEQQDEEERQPHGIPPTQRVNSFDFEAA